jgi:hypothetical protein
VRQLALAALLVPVTALGQHGGDDLPPMMRDPRQVSGVARPEQNDPPGQLTVRAVQGEMKRTEFGDIQSEFPAGTPVHLVGIDHRGQLTMKTLPLDEGGRAVFQHLSTDGSVSYYALAIFPRQGPSGIPEAIIEDRLQSRPVQLPPQVGLRMMLAGHGTASGKPPADDVLGDTATEVVPPGEVIIEVDGLTAGIKEVELLRVGSDEPVAKGTVEPAQTVLQPQGRVSAATRDSALRDGLVSVVVKRRGAGVPGIQLQVIPESARQVAAPEVSWTATTDAEGRATIEGIPAGEKVLLRTAVHGRQLESPAFDPPTEGGTRLEVQVDWQEVDSLRARMTGIAASPDAVYVARIAGKGRAYFSSPFQLTSQRGARAQVLVFEERVFFAFHGGAQLDDDRLWFQVQFTLVNPAAVPFDPGPGGLRIPLPAGFRGASVAEEMATRVKGDEGHGLVWRGAIPPGERQFIASFALRVTSKGQVSMDLALPHGAFDSQLVFEDSPGMRIELPAGARQRAHETPEGKKLLIVGDIQRRPGEQVALAITGLPHHPAWHGWTRIGVGLGVVALLGWALWGAALRARAGRSREEELEVEREDLLQAMVQLEADHRKRRIGDQVYRKNREVLAGKLEGIYAELATLRGGAAGASAAAGAASEQAGQESRRGEPS